MKYFLLAVVLVTAGCAATTGPSPGDPTFKSLTDAQAYYDRLEQQQKKMLANFPSIRRSPCPPEPGQMPSTPQS
ncbi:MAG TPA: hypothetical protein VFI05_09325 [Nitrospiraceae bacterium]|nr:hypothetical protein [Nitrospiraceae bacterium]